MQHPNIALLGLALSLCHCYAQTEQHKTPAILEPETPALSNACGNAELDPDEECDPAADGWQDSCDADCQRTSYVSCQTASDCGELNANCSAYTPKPAQLFCAPFCEQDQDCPQLPGFESRCNFAWCAVTCHETTCPHGMTCSPGHTHLDHRGERIGSLDVCVIERSSRE